MLRIRYFCALLLWFGITDVCAALPVLVDSASAHSRAYGFSFGNGNLVANWSFEDENYFWGFDGENAAVKRAAGLAALCGKACAPVTGSSALWVGPASVARTGLSDLFEIEPGQDYVLSLFALSSGLDRVSPAVIFYSDAQTVAQEYAGHGYTNDGHWIVHTDRFKAPQDARFARIVLYSRLGNADGYLLLDDVLFEKGRNPSDRSTIGVSVAYGDGLGRVHQSQVLLDRQWSSELVPTECLGGYTVYGTSFASVGARAKIGSGNIGSNDSLYIDNDVVLPSPDGAYITLRSGGGLRLGDRVRVHGDIRYGGILQLGSPATYTGSGERETAAKTCEIEARSLPENGADVYVNNDRQYALPPGEYGDAMFRARSTVTLSAGDYYFKSFHLEPQAVLRFDLADGHVRIHVRDGLRIDDNTRFEYDSTGTHFMSWYSAQTSTLRLGTISNLAGVFVLPNARVELGHQSVLKGFLYGKEADVMADSKIQPPAFLFHVPKATWAVASSERDEFGRGVRSALPFPAGKSAEGLVRSPFGHAGEYYSATGGGADAKGYPYAENVYSRSHGTVDEASVPGSEWRVGGGHTQKGGWFFTGGLDIPAQLTAYQMTAGADYHLSWSRDAQGRTSLTWKDQRGLVAQTAVSPGGPALDMRTWTWSVSRYEYNSDGRLIRTLTPLDVQNGGNEYSEYINYDAQGRVVAKYGPDRGLEKYWYARTGELRYAQSQAQRARGAYTYADYDAQGRKTSAGEIQMGGFSDGDVWELAENDMTAAAGGSHTEYGGSAYDQLADCLTSARLGNFKALFDTLDLGHARGRKACSWSRNAHAVAELGDERALVAEFYRYDAQGRLVRSYRYTGSVGDASERLRSLDYDYDGLDRLSSVSYRGGKGQELARSVYAYDEKGRVASITGKDDMAVVSFGYSELGELVHANLGADVRIDYAYHLHGQVKSIKATRISTGALLYSQDLGYEEKVATGTAEPRYDGLITQNLARFAQDVAQSPERLAEYDYDGLGRLVEKNGTDGEFAMDYDVNGRVMKQENGSEALTYAYNDGSYRPDHVNGTTPLAPNRDMSLEGNFQWDNNGRMIYDASRDLLINYDATGLPTEFRKLDLSGEEERTLVQTQLYGPDGQRTATFDYVDSANAKILTRVRTDVVLGGRKRSEVWESYATDGTVTSVNEHTMLQGRSGIVGRERPDGLAEWYVKDYQGSLALSVVGNGYGSAFAYHPYGAQNLLRTDGQPPAEQYTGKEWDGTYEFYYYGARFLDPVLGMWMVPDPAGQYANPYGFGGDPVNYTDPDGQFIVAAIAVGALIGAYMGASSANDSFDPRKWKNNWDTWEGALTGAAVGGIAGGAGAFVAAPAFAGGLGWGATAGMVAGSTSGSLTSAALNNGDGDISTNFGAFSINWTGGSATFNNPFDDDPWYQNVGDGLGWIGNVSDAMNYYQAVQTQKQVLKDIETAERYDLMESGSSFSDDGIRQELSMSNELCAPGSSHGCVDFSSVDSKTMGTHHTHAREIMQGEYYRDFAVKKPGLSYFETATLDNSKMTYVGSNFHRIDQAINYNGLHYISYPKNGAWLTNLYRGGALISSGNSSQMTGTFFDMYWSRMLGY